MFRLFITIFILSAVSLACKGRDKKAISAAEKPQEAQSPSDSGTPSSGGYPDPYDTSGGLGGDQSPYPSGYPEDDLYPPEDDLYPPGDEGDPLPGMMDDPSPGVMDDPMDTDPMDPDPMDSDPMDSDPMDSDPMDTDPMDTDPMGPDSMDNPEDDSFNPPNTNNDSDFEPNDSFDNDPGNGISDQDNFNNNSGPQLNNQAMQGALEKILGPTGAAIFAKLIEKLKNAPSSGGSLSNQSNLPDWQPEQNPPGQPDSQNSQTQPATGGDNE